jgi:hypothetical protein
VEVSLGGSGMRFIPSRCASKVNYRRRKLALTRCAEISIRHGENLTAYKCTECHGWHIGHAQGAPRTLAELVAYCALCGCEIEVRAEEGAPICHSCAVRYDGASARVTFP